VRKNTYFCPYSQQFVQKVFNKKKGFIPSFVFDSPFSAIFALEYEQIYG